MHVINTIKKREEKKEKKGEENTPLKPLTIFEEVLQATLNCKPQMYLLIVLITLEIRAL